MSKHSKDLFINSTANLIGPGGIKCLCCDMRLSHKRNSKIGRNLLSRIRRSRLKMQLKKELEDELSNYNRYNLDKLLEEINEDNLHNLDEEDWG